MLLGHGPRTNFNGGTGLRTGYIRGSGFVAFILLLYPICWACSEGGNVISPTSEAVWYGVLDLLLGPVFLFYFLFGLRNLDYAAFGLQSWKYSDTGVGGAGPTAGAGAAGAGYGASRGVGNTTNNSKAAEAGVAPSTTAPGASTAPANTTTGAGNDVATAV